MIIWIWKTQPGSKHDYTILKKSWFMKVLKKHNIWCDLGFQWVQTDYPDYRITKPKKKTKKKELTKEEKEENYLINWIRVLIENIIGRVKKYKIIVHRYRNRTNWNYRTVRKDRKNQIMIAVCWLYNLEKFIA